MRKKTIIISIINIALVLICFVGITFSWLAMNDTIQGNGLQIAAHQDVISLSHFVYKYNDDLREGYDATNDTDAFELPPYDSIILSRNEHSSIIIKLLVSGEAVNKGEPITLSFFCRETASDTKSLSNVLHFKIGLFNIEETEPALIYQIAEQNFLDSTTKISFVDNGEKQTGIAYVLSGYNDFIQNMFLNVYIQIDYNPELVQDVGAISYDDLTQIITYTPDIYLLQLTANEEED